MDPTYGRAKAKAGRPARTYIQQLCEDTGCSPEAMNDREKWRERVRDIRASGTTWWWWWWTLIILFDINHFGDILLNDFKYCYLILTFLLIPTQHYFFVCTQLNGFKNSKGLNSSIWLIDETLTGNTHSELVDPGIKTIKEYSILPRASEQECHHQIV